MRMRNLKYIRTQHTCIIGTRQKKKATKTTAHKHTPRSHTQKTTLDFIPMQTRHPLHANPLVLKQLIVQSERKANLGPFDSIRIVR
mmetsp:Transcript_1526/g.3269  ORF Transcript_1526/g.3269 Transcript_1526/m.3269 type:complete len:86 (-) Transcript_1526:139-396(-)